MAKIQPNLEDSLRLQAEMISQMIGEAHQFLAVRNARAGKGERVSISSLSKAATGDHTLLNRVVRGSDARGITLFKYAQVLAYLRKHDPKGHLPGIDDDTIDGHQVPDHPPVAAE